MRVTEKDVTNVAALASLELTDSERDRMLRDLNQILDYIDRLNELNTEGVPPMAHAAGLLATLEHRLREDKTRPSLPHDAAMRNAPDSDGTYFRVPKVIER